MSQINQLIATLFRKEVLAMSAYKVADAHGLIKLDAMENPYTWPEEGAGFLPTAGQFSSW